jgi:aspartyl-tRNA synthetase
MTFTDLRDRYGITQLVFNMEEDADLCRNARELGREYVLQVTGIVAERSNKNNRIPTGEIEILVRRVIVLNRSELPPFTIEDDTDGGDELRMKYRYLDLRRRVVRDNLLLRHRMTREVRSYMDSQGFIEVETPVLYKSTPEGARDYVVPSRIYPGEFYALPQSPQTLKQLLMVAGFDRYYQIVKCFRDEDLRADRQPEFTQIDCEMSFVDQNDVLNTFEGLALQLFRQIKGVELSSPFIRLPYSDAISLYGTDKPDLRFEMKISEITDIVRGRGFQVFDSSEFIGAIACRGASDFTRKQIDEITEFVKRPQIGAKGLVWIKQDADGTFRSSVDKFYDSSDLNAIATAAGANAGDLILILAGERLPTLKALGELRLEMGNRLGLRAKDVFIPLWVVDFPLLEWGEEEGRYFAMHHPFTSPKPEDIDLLEKSPGDVRANAYDLVINGVEIGGGSIRIHDRELQGRLFRVLGYTDEEAQKQFGFLLNAFRYGAPPHGGIAFGFDRWTALMGGSDSIRDFIAFPKNNSAKDIMINSPSPVSDRQLEELSLKVDLKKK